MPLTARQRLFVDEYLIDLNARQAALRAGYAPATARSKACGWVRTLRSNSTNTEIWDAVNSALEARRRQSLIKQDRVLEELAHIAFADVREAFDEAGKLKPITELPEALARATATIEVNAKHTHKLKLLEKLRALELLGRHLVLFNMSPNEEDVTTRKLSPAERLNRLGALLDAARARRDRSDTD